MGSNKLQFYPRLFHLVVFGLLLFTAREIVAVTPFALDWKTNTYTPPGYMGKKLPSEGSTITVTATPLTGVSTQYYYKWYLNGVRQNDWVLGRTQFVFIVGSRDMTVEMKAGRSITRTSASGVSTNIIEEVGSERIVLRILSPQLFIFQEQGDKFIPRVQTTIRSGVQVRFKAVPYFYNIAVPSALQFHWNFLGNDLAGIDAQPDELLLSIKEGASRFAGMLTVRAEDNQRKGAGSELKISVE